MAESVSEQLAWESKFGRLAAVAAALAAIFFIAAGLYLQIALSRPPSASNQLLAQIDRELGDYLVTGALSALASILLGVVLFYLYRVTRARRGQLPSAAVVLAFFGVVAAAGVAIARPIDLAAAAASFSSAALRSAETTEDLLRERGSFQVIGFVALAGNLALGFSVILISINAIKAGLFSRVMGGVGIAVGALFPFVGLNLIFMLWLAALGGLFLGRWPGGRGPAWETGEAIAWPTLAQRNAELDRRRAAAEVGEEDAGDPQPEASPADASVGERGGANQTLVEDAGNGDAPAGSRPKRKRGRRR